MSSDIKYKLLIVNSDYTKFKLEPIDISSIEKVETIEFIDNPLLAKTFFHNDIVRYNKHNNTLELLERIPTIITGELEIHSKYILKSNTNSPSYIFKPLERHYPKFTISFGQKSKYNKNIMIRIHNLVWPSNQTLPLAQVYDVIGQVDKLDTLLDSLIYSKLLMPRYNKANKKTLQDSFERLILEEKSKRKQIDNPIISIDPPGCRDIDDAFSFKETAEHFILQIHIADVYSVLDGLDYDPFISDSIISSTIYLPNGKNYPMLPEILSSNLCSLLEKQDRLMLTLEIECHKFTGKCNYKFYPSIGKVYRNYNYNNSPKDHVEIYSLLETIYYYFTKQKFNILDSHSMIECLMLTYNYVFGLYGIDNKNTIYRVQDKSNQEHKTTIYNTIEDKILTKFLSTISSKSAYYSFSSELHSSLNLTGYTHMSSPIRRLVDLIGQEVYYTGSSNMINRDPNILDIVNRQSKLIKQLERDMNKIALAHMAYNSNNPNNKYITTCYLYKVDIDRNRKYLYFPKENISIVDSIVHNSILATSNIYIEDNCLVINSDVLNYIVHINKLISINIYGSPNIYDIDSSIIISF